MKKTFSSIIYSSKIWRQSKCSSVGEWIKKVWNIYTVEYYKAVKKKELLPFRTAWIDTEIILLSEISPSEKEIPHDLADEQNRNRGVDMWNRHSSQRRGNWMKESEGISQRTNMWDS